MVFVFFTEEIKHEQSKGRKKRSSWTPLMASIGRVAEVDSPRKENRRTIQGDETKKGSYTMCVVEGGKGGGKHLTTRP